MDNPPATAPIGVDARENNFAISTVHLHRHRRLPLPLMENSGHISHRKQYGKESTEGGATAAFDFELRWERIRRPGGTQPVCNWRRPRLTPSSRIRSRTSLGRRRRSVGACVARMLGNDKIVRRTNMRFLSVRQAMHFSALSCRSPPATHWLRVRIGGRHRQSGSPSCQPRRSYRAVDQPLMRPRFSSCVNAGLRFCRPGGRPPQTEISTCSAKKSLFCSRCGPETPTIRVSFVKWSQAITPASRSRGS